MAQLDLSFLLQTRARRNAGRQLALIRAELANAAEAARALDAQQPALSASPAPKVDGPRP
jgi:hypothetical protein